MSFDEIINSIETIVSEIAAPALWDECPPERRTAFVKCAIYDVAAYTASVSANLSINDDFFQRAAAEQAIHIAKQILIEKNGLVITEENINGFGSRRYQMIDPSTIAERSKMYINSGIERKLSVRTAR